MNSIHDLIWDPAVLRSCLWIVTTIALFNMIYLSVSMIRQARGRKRLESAFLDAMRRQSQPID